MNHSQQGDHSASGTEGDEVVTDQARGAKEPAQPPMHGDRSRLSPRAAYLSASLLLLLLADYFLIYEGRFLYEGRVAGIVFGYSTTLALIAVLTLLARRLLFATVLVSLFVVAIASISHVKFSYMNLVLHAYDPVFYFTSRATLRFLWADHPAYVVLAFVLPLLVYLLARLIHDVDPTRISRWKSVSGFVVCASVSAGAADAKGDRQGLDFFADGLYLTSFYTSWPDAIRTAIDGQFMEAAAGKSTAAFRTPSGCTPGERPPHIVLIHQESVIPPSFFSEIRYDSRLDPFFTSWDGTLRKLRVETYGGASWLTEFSVVSGLSTYSFGRMRPYLQGMMRGRLHDTLPQSLARCGYENAVFYPLERNFVSNGPFYVAAGLPTIFDLEAQGARNIHERDRFYYGNVMKHLSAHVRRSSKPAFTFVITSATHLPYTSKYAPEVDVPGGGPGTDPELDEYLRRLFLAKLDYDEFRADLTRLFPSERFLIVSYGDHQPIVTRTFLGARASDKIEDMFMSPESRGFLTYYAVDGVNYSPAPLRPVEALDVPYLGAVLLESAGLPLSDAFAERLRLLEQCRGRYYTCGDRRLILGFHRQLIDSGLVEVR